MAARSITSSRRLQPARLGNMSRVTSISKARETRKKKSCTAVRHGGFVPCSPDMTICGDCEDNREKNKCPRLKEWLEKRNS